MLKQYDVTVIGGGMAGVSAAIAAAREGMKVALLNDRTVLGGNASSEVRMHIVGATRHGCRENLRETGIIEEILLENKYRNPEHSYAIFDIILWEKVKAEKNIDLYLNTYAFAVEKKENKISSVKARQLTTEKEFDFVSNVYIDCSGDGYISYLADAEVMFGREAKSTFNEPGAVEKYDTVTMGNTIQFRSLEAKRPVPFVRPDWAYDYSDAEWAKNMNWEEITSGYWWLEIGGTEWNCVTDAEITRDEMLKIVLGLWDYIKNHSSKREQAKNYYLDWVGFLPSKRESRRIVGDYVLNENDILENKIFPDAIGYGGWHLDTHRPEGFYAFVNQTPHEVDKTVHFDGIYTVPYRSIYAKGLDNLLLGGRIISASHRAFASTRVMATCAVLAEAAGIAAAIAVKKGFTVPEVGNVIDELQQKIMKNGCYIPGFKNEDSNDLASRGSVSATNEVVGCEAENIINGFSRTIDGNSNMWQGKQNGDSVVLTLENKTKVKEVILTFDSNLSVEIMLSLSKWHQVKQAYSVPETIVKDYEVEYLLYGKTVKTEKVEGNYQRINKLSAGIECDQIKVTVTDTHGAPPRICEIRVY